MQRWSTAALLWCGTPCVALVAFAVAATGPAAAAGVSVRVTPGQGLVSGETVTVSGRGLGGSSTESSPWFVTECTATVKGHLNPATDTPHCDITHAQRVRVSNGGSFSARYHVTAGIVGDGWCGTPGHATCVIAVGTAAGKGATVPITFRTSRLVAPPAASTTTTATATS